MNEPSQLCRGVIIKPNPKLADHHIAISITDLTFSLNVT